MAIIQLGLDEQDDAVYVQSHAGKWKLVPAWILCEWQHKGGILGLVMDYDLHKMTHIQPHEYTALWNVAEDARAVRRFVERDRNYLDALNFSPLMQQLVDLEIQLMQRHGWMKVDDVLDRMVEIMEERGVYLSNRQVAGYLREADDIMRAALREVETGAIERAVKHLLKVAA